MDNIEQMVHDQIEKRGIHNKRVLNAIRKVKRELFVPAAYQDSAYGDHPLAIGFGQTISQPYIVALMTQLCALSGKEKVLEIGTGSGYQTAILAELAQRVFSIERIKELAEIAKIKLKTLGYSNVTVIEGNGYEGLLAEAPFDVIILTAAPPQIPDALTMQLKEGGILIGPEGTFIQHLIRIKKHKGTLHRDNILPVSFVPMVQ